MLFLRTVRAHRSARLVALVAVAALGLSACGADEEPSTPSNCFADAAEYAQALAAAPGDVVLGQTPIADCLPNEQPAGDLAEIGRQMTIAASGLVADASRGDREAAVAFGYLLGVVEVRADASPVHYDLGLRIGSEQAPLADTSNAVRAAVADGLDAGRSAAGEG